MTVIGPTPGELLYYRWHGSETDDCAAESGVMSLGFLCRLGLHVWRAIGTMTYTGAPGPVLERCRRCGKERWT